MNTVSCIIDFNESSKIAIAYATWLANKNSASLHIIHLLSSGEDKSTIEEQLLAFCSMASVNVPHSVTLGTGNYLKKIPEMLQENPADLLVIGASTTPNEAEVFVPANVVKLAQALDIPTLVVNQNTPSTEPNFKEILFPIAPHKNFSIQTEEATKWANANNAKIDVLCLISEGQNLPADIAVNLENCTAYFNDEKIDYTKTLKETKVYSVGYAKDIIHYAGEKHFDLITIMAQNSEENMYFGNVEKTNLIQNPMGLPVLFIKR